MTNNLPRQKHPTARCCTLRLRVAFTQLCRRKIFPYQPAFARPLLTNKSSFDSINRSNLCWATRGQQTAIPAIGSNRWFHRSKCSITKSDASALVLSAEVTFEHAHDEEWLNGNSAGAVGALARMAFHNQRPRWIENERKSRRRALWEVENYPVIMHATISRHVSSPGSSWSVNGEKRLRRKSIKPYEKSLTSRV